MRPLSSLGVPAVVSLLSLTPVPPLPPLARPVPAAEVAGVWLQSEDHFEPELLVTSEAAWPADGWLVFDVRYEGPRCGIVRLQVDAGRGDGRRGLAGFTVLPQVPARLAFPLAFLNGQALKLERRPGSLRNGYNGPPMTVDEVREIRLSLKTAAAPQRLHIKAAWLADAEPDYPVAPVVLVDPLGQWTQRDWPGKTRDEAELRARLQAEHAHALAAPATLPAGWSRYGGDDGHRFAPTGWFRTERADDRWWLVDPDGAAFFSIGLDGVTPGVAGRLIPGEEGYYAEPPGGSGPLNFAERNLARVFADEWREPWLELTRDRLVRWGFNTIANWSDPAMRAGGGLPYVLQWPRFPGTAVALFRDFPDVFDPAYEQDAAACAQSLAATRDDVRLIGYFMMNEPKWAFGDFNLAALMLEAHPGSHTRRALASWIAERYAQDATRWAQAWALPRSTEFGRLVQGTWGAEELAAATAQDDLWAFSRVMMRRFVEVPVRAARAVDPHHLNLGLRFAYIPNDLVLEGGELFDVFSINAYGMAPPLRVIDQITRRTGRPVMIGEFHFGALDRGLPSTGLRGVRTQVARGQAYQHYVEQAAAHPAVVGTHWFYLNDQPLLGRGDGENYQIGFVDVCQRPYEELVMHAQATHQRIYEVARGRRPPISQAVEEIPNNLYPSATVQSWRAQQ